MLDFVSREVLGNLVENTSFDLVFFEGHRLLLDVHTLVDASLSKNVLFNGPIYIQVPEAFRIGRGAGLPLRRRDDLG